MKFTLKMTNKMTNRVRTKLFKDEQSVIDYLTRLKRVVDLKLYGWEIKENTEYKRGA